MRRIRLTIVLIALIALCVVLFYLPAELNSVYSGYRQSSELLEAADSPMDVEEKQNNQTLTKCGDLPALYPDSIPPIVHWTSKDGRVPPRLQPLIKSWRLLLNSSQSSWRFMHWSDQQLAHLISKHYPFLLPSYNKLANGLERSDIGRLVVLHHVGGVYVDMDVELRRDLSPWLSSVPAEVRNLTGISGMNAGKFTAVWSQEPLEHAIFHFELRQLIANSVILSRSKHSFLTYLLYQWPAWFEANWAKKHGRNHGHAVQVTGPLMINSFYEKYLALASTERPLDSSGTVLLDAIFFQPLWDVMYIPSKLKDTCIRQLPALSELKKRHCQRLAATKFRTQRVPTMSYTVHRYMHLSYSQPAGRQRFKNIGNLLPIFKCTV